MNAQDHPYALAPDQAGPGYTYFGWHGWGLCCPREWNPVVLSADRRNGSCVLADLDRQRIEISWKTQPKDRTPDLQKTIDTQTERLTGRSTPYEPPEHDNPNVRFSKLVYDRDDRIAMIAMHSLISNRALVVKLSLTGLHEPIQVAHTIIRSIRDHTLDQPNPWAAYDLACWAPANFELSTRQIIAGSTRLHFTHKATAISFWKASPIADNGGMTDPTQWFARADRKPRHWYRFTDTPTTSHGHAAIHTTGRMPWHRWPGQWYRRNLLALAWYCPKSNRIFQVLTTGWAMPDQRLQDGADGMVCHLNA